MRRLTKLKHPLKEAGDFFFNANSRMAKTLSKNITKKRREAPVFRREVVDMFHKQQSYSEICRYFVIKIFLLKRKCGIFNLDAQNAS